MLEWVYLLLLYFALHPHILHMLIYFLKLFLVSLILNVCVYRFQNAWEFIDVPIDEYGGVKNFAGFDKYFYTVTGKFCMHNILKMFLKFLMTENSRLFKSNSYEKNIKLCVTPVT